jgi:hypothetical protein
MGQNGKARSFLKAAEVVRAVVAALRETAEFARFEADGQEYVPAARLLLGSIGEAVRSIADQADRFLDRWGAVL